MADKDNYDASSSDDGKNKNDAKANNKGDDNKGSDGNDVVDLNVSKGGPVQKDLDAGDDVVRVDAKDAGQVRLTFTSADVGNGKALDGNNDANEDDGLAVRLQREGDKDNLVGPESRFDDEGITFVSQKDGLTFDVRDLPTGTARGDQFEVVRLGTINSDNLNSEQQPDRPYYINAGMGNDTVTGGNRNDFLVGGAGDDTLQGNRGNDTLLGGAGNDTAIFNVSTDGADSVNLGAGNDVVLVSAAAAGQVRLTFTSAEVGNGSANDSGALTNQDGGLARAPPA